MGGACENWFVEDVLFEQVLDTGEKSENFQKFCQNSSVENDVLMYKGRYPSIKKIVPTPEQVWVVHDPIHRGGRKKHVCHEQTLVVALSEAGYAVPIAIIGFSKRVTVYMYKHRICLRMMY